jgi:hypothetical protein
MAAARSEEVLENDVEQEPSVGPLIRARSSLRPEKMKSN